jgi:hypothetical protein
MSATPHKDVFDLEPEIPGHLSLPARFGNCAKQGCRIMTRDLDGAPAHDVPRLPHRTNDSNVAATLLTRVLSMDRRSTKVEAPVH